MSRRSRNCPSPDGGAIFDETDRARSSPEQLQPIQSTDHRLTEGFDERSFDTRKTSKAQWSAKAICFALTLFGFCFYILAGETLRPWLDISTQEFGFRIHHVLGSVGLPSIGIFSLDNNPPNITRMCFRRNSDARPLT